VKVLITGSNGQLGWELQRTVPEGINVIALNSKALNVCDAENVHRVVHDLTPHVVINAAAYTAVDDAEQETDRAYAVNKDAVSHLAQISTQFNARLIHFSTDYVYDGNQNRPYRIDDPTNPQCVYGKSKLEGERIALHILGDRATILRTSWVYSSHGNNFVKTMLRLMAQRDQLGIVMDQIGSPSWARGLANITWKMVTQKRYGIYHWTDAGVASWYDFAVAIQEEAIHLKLLEKPITIRPISTSDYPLPAKRPYFSVLDKSDTWSRIDITPSHWREALRSMLKELATGRTNSTVGV
jgi:dTDP-4-dehydrorhamnose reductase